MSKDHRPGATRGTLVLAVALLCCFCGSVAGAASPAPDENRYNDELLRLPEPERAAKLAEHLGMGCIGTKPFFMGMTKTGPAKGYAYWSLTCAGAKSYVIQIAPDGTGAATDCQTLKDGGEGRECYKNF
jgi:hypothetical protein